MVLRFLMFAGIFFLISCGDIERNNPDDPSSPNYQGGVSPPLQSSSSATPSSPDINYGVVMYNDETYSTVKIGTQTWFQRNLNYAAGGSKCYGEDGPVYNPETGMNDLTLSNSEIQANCVTYGRLYNWLTAMDLPEDCYYDPCSSLIKKKHQGICPEGWHIPSNADWDELMRYVDGTRGTDSPYTSPTAGVYLKTQGGWNSSWDDGGNGQDKYAFSALPGGHGSSFGSFEGIGSGGYWWSASDYSDGYAYYRLMLENSDYASAGNYYKSGLFSVRCLKD